MLPEAPTLSKITGSSDASLRPIEAGPTSLGTFLIKAARPGFWITSAWFFLLPLAGRDDLLLTAQFWLGLAYVTFPLGLFIYGWNDCADADTDKLNPRKGTFLFGARGNAEQLRQLPVWIAIVQLPFALVFIREFGWARTAFFFAALASTTALYNGPRGGTKSRPWLDLLNQAGYLLVFLLSSWINHVPQLPWYTWLFGAMFAMHSHLFGQIMDLEPDLQAGRRTTAIVLGRFRAKWLLATILVAEAVLILFTAHDFWISIALVGGAIAFAIDACWMWKAQPYAAREARLFFLAWNAAALLSAPWVWKMATLV